ncbi:tRNA pseudouridine(55) synthase TruB [Clostridium cylindrosporum]|uniref:tRNA pseudouridine synthase B n=1 Tax=Clostridium cylindrosporum DSM 605 TaxID=1121307 RepID=A0A0J8G611_CLOCY|nr:tRNA pseudouridine(55) synthase TruB [Clostridium cylindrosporum]KMT23061.1 tRNA pseudouridine synthase B [Clostridium cylindrosporum DSM 605]
MNGILNILKPPGMTSHDVVSFVRRNLRTKKVGHTGTLDPGAAGVLPICIGKGTKIVEYLTEQGKEYICEVTFGNESDTCDKYGTFIYEEDKDYSHITKEMVNEKLELFKGRITQTPPIYSAIKINGQRAYDLARQGIEFEVPKREVTIYNIELLSFNLPKAQIKINCSKGTYVRSICRDLGNSLNCPAYMSFLLRTKTGPFDIDGSVILDDINLENIDNILYPINYGISMKELFIDDKFSDKVLNGNPIKLDGLSGYKDGEKVKAFIKPSTFIGVGHIKSNIFKIDKLMV